jgi:hypothetical protein
LTDHEERVMGAGYRLILVPDEEDSFQEAAKVAPRVSKDQPIDVTTARALLLARIEEGKGVLRGLRDLAEVLPVSKDRDAMFGDDVPYDEASFIFGAVDDAVRETLPSMFAALHRAATVTDEELVRDFFDRHEGYLAEQKRRLGGRS